MKKAQINAMLKKGNFSPFMVAKLMFNDIWRESQLQEPIFSHTEKQSLVDKMGHGEYHQFTKWKNWFVEINEICSKAKEFYLEAETRLFKLLWFIEKDLNREESRTYFKNMYPVPVTEKQYQDLKKKDREGKLKEKYSITSCLIEIIEDKLPGPEKGLTLEDYICDEDKDRKLIAGHFRTAVTTLINLINQGKIKPTRKAQLLPALKAALKKTPDQVAEILLAGIYNDVEVPVKILEESTITGEQLYKNFKGWAKFVDTFYPETGGGYAVVQDENPLFLDKNGYYKPVSILDKLLNGGSEYFSRLNGNAYIFFYVKLNTVADNFYFFQFNRMMLDELSDELSIELNQGLESQAEYLEACRSMLFNNLAMIVSDKKLIDLIHQYKNKTVEKYYPTLKVVNFCKNHIHNMSEYKPDWFYDIKDFYMKEERIKAMTAAEIEGLKSMGNKEQVKHFLELVDQVNSNDSPGVDAGISGDH